MEMTESSRKRADVTIIIEQLSGSDTCSAEGIAVKAKAPIFALCRRLVAAGFNPAASLFAYRGDTMCVRARSIGEAAMFTVTERDRDGLKIERWRPFPAHAVALKKSKKITKRPSCLPPVAPRTNASPREKVKKKNFSNRRAA
jgi:hypothetical protein